MFKLLQNARLFQTFPASKNVIHISMFDILCEEIKMTEFHMLDVCAFILRQIFKFGTQSFVLSAQNFVSCPWGWNSSSSLSTFSVISKKRKDLVCMFVVMAIFTVRFLFPCTSSCEHENIFSYLTNCV